LLLNIIHQQQILQIQAKKKLKGCPLPTIEKKVQLGIGLVVTQAKVSASLEDTNGKK